MQVSKFIQSPTRISMKISLAEAELEPIKTHVLQTHFSEINIPGFREGRAPLAVIEKSADPQRLANEVLEHAINEFYRRAVDEKKIRPVGQPQIEMKKFVPYTTLEFDVTQDVIGEIKMPDYKKIKLAKPKASVTAAEVKNVLDSLGQRMAERIEAKRPAKLGDEVIIDFRGVDDKNEAIAGADGKEYPLVLGSGAFIPGFEEKVVGLKAGDIKEFPLTFPKDYGVANMQGKKVTFTVTLKKVNQLKLPALDDDFAKKAGPFKSIEELKQDIKSQLQVERETQSKREYENELIRTIAKKTTVEIPEALVEDQINQMENAERQNLAYRGQIWEEHLKEEKVSVEQHRERHKPEAKERVKGGLILSEIAVKEGLEVSEDELNERIAQLKLQYTDQAMRAELDKPENRQDILARILTEKTIEKLVAYASK